MAKRISQNIFANIAGRIWAFISIYLFVPIYIKLLGIEQYGIIIFYTTLLTILTFADSGLTATLTREFAREVQIPHYKANLLRTFETIYYGVFLLIILVTWGGSDWIISLFLKSNVISHNDLVNYVRLMGITIAFYIFSSLYQGGLIGLQRQVTANILSISYNAIKAGLVIIPLLFSANIYTYLYWQIGVTIIYCLISRYCLTKYINMTGAHSCFNYLKNLWKYAAGMILMAIIYATNTQIDKLLIGNVLSLTDLSYYFLASSIGQATLILVTPIGTAFFPELTKLISLPNQSHNAIILFHQFSFIISAIASTIGIILIYYAQSYITIWQHDTYIASIITPTAQILIAGYVFMAIQITTYNLALANGHNRTNIIMGMLTIILIIPGIYLLTSYLGLIGAAIPWLMVNFLVTILMGRIILKKFLPHEFKRWLLNDSLFPIFISITVATPFYYLFNFFPQGYFSIIYGSIIGIITLSANFYIFLKQYPDIIHHRFFTIFKTKH